MSSLHLDQRNARNDGRGFETEMEFTMAGYADRGIARIEKVEPPTRIVGGGMARKVIFLRNPFLDFVGVWTRRGARGVFVEAKSTMKHRLPFCRDGGLTEQQWISLQDWHAAGAVVGVIWNRADLRQTRLLTLEGMRAEAAAGVASIEWERAIPIPAGPGRVIHDFLRVLEPLYFPAS